MCISGLQQGQHVGRPCETPWECSVCRSKSMLKIDIHTILFFITLCNYVYMLAYCFFLFWFFKPPFLWNFQMVLDNMQEAAFRLNIVILARAAVFLSTVLTFPFQCGGL